MEAKDEMHFIWLRDNSRVTYDRIKALLEKKREIDAGTNRDAMDLLDQQSLPGNVELMRKHGEGLRELQGKYPEDQRIGQAVSNYEVYMGELGLSGV